MIIDIVHSLRRDMLAALASEEDCEAQKDKIAKVPRVVTLSNGWEQIEGTDYPKNWRIIARYLHADEMLEHTKLKPRNRL